MCKGFGFWNIVIMLVRLSRRCVYVCLKSKHSKHKYFKPFSTPYITCLLVMPPNLVYVILTVSVIFILCPRMSVAAGTWVCKGCRNNAECDKKPADFCPYGEVRDACYRRVCAKGPSERCGGFMNVLGQCGEGMMCKSDERCHGCFLETMECYNEI